MFLSLIFKKSPQDSVLRRLFAPCSHREFCFRDEKTIIRARFVEAYLDFHIILESENEIEWRWYKLESNAGIGDVYSQLFRIKLKHWPYCFILKMPSNFSKNTSNC